MLTGRLRLSSRLSPSLGFSLPSPGQDIRNHGHLVHFHRSFPFPSPRSSIVLAYTTEGVVMQPLIHPRWTDFPFISIIAALAVAIKYRC